MNSSLQYDQNRHTLNIEEVQYTQSHQKAGIKIHREFEYHPEPDYGTPSERDLETPLKEEWDQIEMFSSKKFSELVAKEKNQNKSRYALVADRDESYIDVQNDTNPDGTLLEVVDILDDSKDVINSFKRSTKQEARIQSPLDDIYDHRIKKVVERPRNLVRKSKGLTYEDLADDQSQNASRMSEKQYSSHHSIKKSNEKVYTTSINLLDNDLISEKDVHYEIVNSKTED